MLGDIGNLHVALTPRQQKPTTNNHQLSELILPTMKNDASNDLPRKITTEMILKALKRSAKEARRLAKMHGTKIWVMQDGKAVGLEP